MSNPIIEIRIAKFWLDEDGIIHYVNLGMPGEHLTDAQESFDAINKLSMGKVRPIFADIRNIKSIDVEARKFYMRLQVKDLVNAIALMIASPISRVIGSMFLGINRPPVPIKLFTSEKQALEWLKGFLVEDAKS